MPFRNSINLVWCCDDNYARHLCVALCSVLHTLSPETEARIYIVHTGLRPRTIKKLQAFLDGHHAEAHFIEAAPERFKGLVISQHITPAAYIRIALPDLLPDTISKVLYLDCDLVAREDITPLAAADIGASPLGAIPEVDQYSWAMNDLKHNAGIPHDAPYFNSGVLLLNLEAWRREGLSKKIFTLVREMPRRIRLHDQDALNIFFHDTYVQLDSRWNITPDRLSEFPEYLAEPVGIVHFVTGIKPWHAGCNHPLKSEYSKYAAMTPWTSTQPPRALFARPWSAMARNGKKFFRKISSLYKTQRSIQARTVMRKEEVARLSIRYFWRSVLFNAGVLQKHRELLLGFSVRFPSYEIFASRFNEIFVENSYYFETKSTRPFIIDCSGDFGMSVLYFKRLFPYSDVLVFESDPERYVLLHENVSANSLDGVELRNIAASGPGESSTQPAEYRRLPQQGRDLARMPETGAGKGTPLSFSIDRQVDFLKIGGSDPGRELLEDLSINGTLDFVKKISITHHHYVSAVPGGLPEILRVLEKHGFRYHLQMGPDGLGAGIEGGQRILIHAART